MMTLDSLEAATHTTYACARIGNRTDQSQLTCICFEVIRKLAILSCDNIAAVTLTAVEGDSTQHRAAPT
jgi:hypothetical protein